MLAIAGGKIRLGFETGGDGDVDHTAIGIEQQLLGVHQLQGQVILARCQASILVEQALDLA